MQADPHRVTRSVLRMYVLLLACACALIMPAAAGAVTVSGIAMKDEVGSTWQGCDGVTANLRIAVEATAVASTTCNATTGAFSFPGVTIPSVGARVAIWFDGAPVKGVLYSSAASMTADITGLTPTQDRVWIRSEQGAVTRDTTFLRWTKANDPDVPAAISGSSLTLDAGMELHVQSPLTFQASGPVDTTSIHVEAGATYNGAAGQTTIRGIGTLPCRNGPGLSRPLCIEGSFAGSGRVEYRGQAKPYTVEPLTYGSLHFAADPGGTGIIGYASGQLLRAQWVDVSSSLRSDPWATNIDVAGMWFHGWSNNGGGATNPSWTGNKPFMITFRWSFAGGNLNLPGATVRGNLESSSVAFGPMGGADLSPDWVIRTAVLRNTGYHRWEFGTAGATAPVGDATVADRVATMVGTPWTNGFGIFALGRNGGDWGIVKYDHDGKVDPGFNGGALLAFNSGGTNVDVPHVAALDPNTGSLLVGGSSAGNWMLRRYTAQGQLDTSFNGTGVLTVDLGGADEIRGLVWQGGTIAVAGTGGATPGWHFRTYTNAGTPVGSLSWSAPGGAPAELRAMCSRNGEGTELYLVGRVGAAGSRDWAAKRINAAWTAWESFGPVAATDAWTWDPGGAEDEATACAAETSDNLYIGGTTGTGTEDDGRVRRFWSNGWPNVGYGGNPDGILSFGTPGDDEVTDLITDDWGDSIKVAGRDPANGGQAIVRHFDPDGDVDTTWGVNGRITWDGSATTNERATALFLDSGQYFRVGVVTSTGTGDAVIRRYDYSGDLMSTWEPGRVRVRAMNSWYERAGMRLEDALVVGDAGDVGPIVVDLENRDLALHSEGDVAVRANGTLLGSSTSPLVANGNLTFDGAFLGNNGAVRLRSQARATVKASATTRFNHLSIEAPSKDVAFDAANPVRVKGTFRVRGTSCSEPVTLRSASDPTAWSLDLAGGGTTDVQFAELRAAKVTPSATATNSRDLGLNTGWTISGCTGSTVPAPDGMQVDGQTHAQGIGTPAPALSWMNRAGATVDRADVEVYSSPRTNQAALWRFDGSGADSAGAWTLTPSATTTYPTGRFAQAADAPANFDGFTGGDLDLPGDFTVDGWLRTTLTTAENHPDVIYKGDATRTAVNYRLGFDKPAGMFEAMMTIGGGIPVRARVPSSVVADGRWHHVAMVNRAGRVMLYVDGELRRTNDDWGTTADQGAWGVRAGWRLGGQIDDWRVSTVAYGPADILGFVKTGRRHADKVWDFDPSDANGTPLASTVANQARASVTYGGVSGSLRLGGARYWARARFRTQSTSAWSNWSDVDWWEMDQSITTSVVTSSSVALSSGAVLAGQDAVSAATFGVSTTNFHGYTTWIEGPSDAWGMSDGLPGSAHELPGRGSTPAPWAPGTAGFIGVSVLSSTGGKDTTRWGTGTTTADLATLNWAWGSPSSRLMLTTRPDYDPSPQEVRVAVRANAAPTTDPGRYSTTLVFTALPNV